MNCRAFQQLIFDYIDGTLPESKRSAAEEHLAGCRACRDSVEQEQRLAESLRSGFQQRVASLDLSPEFTQQVVGRVEPPGLDVEAPRNVIRFPFSLRVSAAAALVLVAFGIGMVLKRPVGPLIPSMPRLNPVTIELSFCVPAYTFQRLDNSVIDALTCEPNTIAGTLFTKID